jgi:hypothetical protein
MSNTVALNAIETSLAQVIGTDFIWDFTDEDGEDLAGRTLSFMLKRKAEHDGADAMLTITTATGITIVGPVA